MSQVPPPGAATTPQRSKQLVQAGWETPGRVRACSFRINSKTLMKQKKRLSEKDGHLRLEREQAGSMFRAFPGNSS